MSGLAVLDVDDEPQVLEVLAELLTADGHRVDIASDGVAGGRVIVLTGDTLSPESEEFLSATQVPTVTKPFSAEDVRRAVQTVARETGKISGA